jgi:NAD-dependent SIR2 family protein deacetylase
MTLSEQLTQFLEKHQRICVMTGAGISTDSGIPDYRDKKANWKRKAPVQHPDFMASHATRQRFWARSLVGWPIMRDAEPNASHRALALLGQHGKISALVTQNVDGLHEKAGHPNTIDLHGRSDRVICTGCSYTLSRDETHDWMARLNPQFTHFKAVAAPDGDADLEGIDFSTFYVPPCPFCQGILKPDVVFYGDHIPKDRVEAAKAAVDNADALWVIGSSLMVYSGFRLCKQAHQAGKPITLLNEGITRADSLATLKLNSDISSVLTPVMARFH